MRNYYYDTLIFSDECPNFGWYRHGVFCLFFFILFFRNVELLLYHWSISTIVFILVVVTANWLISEMRNYRYYTLNCFNECPRLECHSHNELINLNDEELLLYLNKYPHFGRYRHSISTIFRNYYYCTLIYLN